MNDTENETVRFIMKPNPFFYALEFTRHSLIIGTVLAICTNIPLMWPGLYSERGIVLVLITYAVLGLPLFITAYVVACYLMFVVTDKRAIVRSSFWRTTRDGLSIAIKSVKSIQITSYGATYGSVYLAYDKTLPGENSEDIEPDYPQSGPIRRARNEAAMASIPVRRTNSIRVALTDSWPCLLGFYGFKSFDEFAAIVSKQQDSVANFKEG